MEEEDLIVKRNTKANESIVFLPIPTAHLREIASRYAAQQQQQHEDETDESLDEDDEESVVRAKREVCTPSDSPVHSHSVPSGIRTGFSNSSNNNCLCDETTGKQ